MSALARCPVGFLVWSPGRSFPTVQHETFARAEAEAERLRTMNPQHTFWVMAPVKGAKTAAAAKAFSDGKAEGLAQAHAEIMLAEGRADRCSEELRTLRLMMDQVDGIARKREEHQSIVADCLLWFDGFNAAQSGRDSWERPNTPDREKLRRLNGALQALLRAGSDDIADDGIPF